MKMIYATEPMYLLRLPDREDKIIQIENHLRFKGEDLIKEKESEGYNLCVFLNMLDADIVLGQNKVMWRATFLKL